VAYLFTEMVDTQKWKTDEMPVCEQSDVHLYYEVTGEGTPVLFFNGSGATLKTSALLISALAQHCQVLAHDQRGLGRTSIPEGPYTMAQYARDAVALLDEVGWEKCAVVGISFGGMVAQEFAATWPERVSKLVLMCTSAGGDAGSSYPLHELGSLPIDERNARIVELTDTRFTPEWLATHPKDAQMMSMRAEQAKVAKSDEVLRGERLQLHARIGHDVADRLHRITAPTLVTAGQFDGIAPVTNSQEIVARIPQAELRVYQGGHLFTAQDPQALVDISQFLVAE
jgi:3-oxoadipate enol-lactonase